MTNYQDSRKYKETLGIKQKCVITGIFITEKYVLQLRQLKIKNRNPSIF